MMSKELSTNGEHCIFSVAWLQGNDQFDCMQLIADKKADLMQVDPGMGYTGGQYYNLMPVMAEKYTTGKHFVRILQQMCNFV